MAPTTFLSIPQEIRSMIYAYSFSQESLEVTPVNKNEWWLIWLPTRDETHNLLDPIATNAMIADEARTIYFAPLKFTIKAKVPGVNIGAFPGRVVNGNIVFHINHYSLKDTRRLTRRMALLNEYPNLKRLTLCPEFVPPSKFFTKTWKQASICKRLENLCQTTAPFVKKLGDSCQFRLEFLAVQKYAGGYNYVDCELRGSVEEVRYVNELLRGRPWRKKDIDSRKGPIMWVREDVRYPR
ncbi:uncharacterized protein KY384_001313 [Bacidia gigantensis]|uniref:uncharacterized protein n=1 Tax=Bacidia gigantensis TaxID=2732470 RepID=UPI001D048367|nr:uncharacterized protein KY384_001313 [Bacidia gigantensis]KAG8533573.1 hypothetical protein KY384_001313 [Bacidia gigantensis]